MSIFFLSIAKYTISYFVVLHLCSSMPMIIFFDIFLLNVVHEYDINIYLEMYIFFEFIG